MQQRTLHACVFASIILTYFVFSPKLMATLRWSLMQVLFRCGFPSSLYYKCYVCYFQLLIFYLLPWTISFSWLLFFCLLVVVRLYLLLSSYFCVTMLSAMFQKYAPLLRKIRCCRLHTTYNKVQMKTWLWICGNSLIQSESISNFKLKIALFLLFWCFLSFFSLVFLYSTCASFLNDISIPKNNSISAGKYHYFVKLKYHLGSWNLYYSNAKHAKYSYYLLKWLAASNRYNMLPVV